MKRFDIIYNLKKIKGKKAKSHENYLAKNF